MKVTPSYSFWSVARAVLKACWRFTTLGIITHFIDQPRRDLLVLAIVVGLLGLGYLPSTLPAWLSGYSAKTSGFYLHAIAMLRATGTGLAVFFLFCLWRDVEYLQRLRLKITQLESRMAVIRHMGREGEIETSALVQSLRDKMHFLKRDSSWMPSDDEIQDIVLLDQHGSHSQEIDELIVVDHHIFIIEVKHWQGHIRAQGDELLVNGELRKSPDTQTRSKLERIQRQLAADHVKAEVYPLYVFTHPRVELDSELPWNYVTLNNLEAYFKFMRKQVWDAELDSILAQHYLSQIRTSLMKRLDLRPDAKHHHLLFLASRPNPTPQLVEYATLDQQVKNNQTSIQQFDLEACFRSALRWLGFTALIILPAAWYLIAGKY